MVEGFFGNRTRGDGSSAKTGGAEDPLVSSEDSSIAVVAVDDDWLYLAGRIRLSTSAGGRGIGVIQKMPKAGGPLTTLACGLDVGSRFIQDDTYIYWFGALLGTDKRTGISRNLNVPNAQSLLSLADGLAVNSTTVYVGGEHGLGIVPRAGGSALQILPGAYVPSIALDSEHVFWTSAISGVSDRLMRANLDGTEITELPTASAYLLVDDVYVYWMGDGPQGYGPSRMQKDCSGTPRPDLLPQIISAPPRNVSIPACPWNDWAKRTPWQQRN